MEYARLQLYIPDRFGHEKKFSIFERHQFWTSAAFILILYTAWTLYRIKRPTFSLMESIILQRMEDAYNEIINEKKESKKQVAETDIVETAIAENNNISIEKFSLDTNVFDNLNEELRNIEIADLLLNANDKKQLEDVTLMYDLNDEDLTENSSSDESSSNLWTDNDCNTVYHLSDDENNRSNDTEDSEIYSDTDDIEY
ncbi:uncharacterized protein [Rhodnius prolixus]|uniref:uncharacterized protein n=1 Tax=Rhodnius prolixus TaxID=13249 RepID=UPI003D18FAB7